ncbi:MAG: hypothetical protein PWP02_467 [Thermosipho sp. (in: thermotogales)]|jgi:superfamily II DNA or RNA helicase|nr:hypothetical protein [Thermosipho sp. (in: thermotogales)]
MSFKNLYLKRSYSSDSDDILNEFYLPVLENSISYSRLSGFFTSESLSLAARGIIGLIKNNGKMKLIVSPKLSYDDLITINNALQNPEKFLNDTLSKDLKLLEDEFLRDHLFALGWMIANKKLEIKIALVYDEDGKLLSAEDILESGIFHQKIGIFTDIEGNKISFSGSVNETFQGWEKNIEEFKVFRSWIEVEKDYVEEDILKFNKFWNNLSENVKVIDLPVAIKRKLINLVPKDFKIEKLNRWYKKIEKREIKKIKLFKHQLEAIENLKGKNFRGIISMATGTGKTYTAIGAIDEIMKENIKNFIVISVPYSHLIDQWENSVRKYNLNVNFIIKCFSGNSKWYSDLKKYTRKLLLGQINNLLIISTHNTLISEKMNEILETLSDEVNKVLVADEVHGIGSLKRRENLSEVFNERIGLSATPKRMYDEYGNRFLKNYFGDIVYEFSLCDAIYNINPLTYDTFLTPYYYYPYLCSLTEEETRKYLSITKKILNKIKSKDDSDFYVEIEDDEEIKKLLIRRSKIIKSAVNKLEVLKNILSDIKEKDGEISHTIIFTDDKLIDVVLEYLKENKIFAYRFTQELSNKDRIKVLEDFGDGIIQILVAMKILDEGVDVPESKNAVIMSSSTNPREFIQRIGRVLRRSKNKRYSYIFDIITKPKYIEDSVLPIENKLFKAEKERVNIIAKCAVNYKEIMFKVNNL